MISSGGVAAPSTQLDKELRTLSAVLVPNKPQPLERDEWCRRRAALERLTALARAGAMNAPDGVHLLSRWIRRAIMAQLADPRSAIVMATCAFLVALSAATSVEATARVATVCSWWVPSVLKCTMNTAHVVVDAAQSVLDELTRRDLWNYESTRAHLLACESKHNRTRLHALITLTHRLQYVQGTSRLETFGSFRVPLRRVIKMALEDADVEVRRAARVAFVAFEAVFPGDAPRVLALLQLSTRSALEHAREDAQSSLQLVSTHRGVDAATTPKNSSRRLTPPRSVFDLPRTMRTLDSDLLKVAAERARQVRYVARTPSRRRSLLVSSTPSHHAAISPTVTSRAAPTFTARLESIRGHLRSADWAAREAALRELGSLLSAAVTPTRNAGCSSDNAERLTHDQYQEVLELVVPLSDDGNVRVAQRAHEVIRAVVQAAPTLVEPFLHHLCGVLLRFAASRRKTSQDAAVLLLETLAQLTDTGILCTAVAHALEGDPAPAIRHRGVDVLAYAISHKAAELAGAGVVPLVLRCLAAELHEETRHQAKGRVRVAAVAAVGSLYDADSGAFARACAQLTGTDLRLVSDALRVSHPELDDVPPPAEGATGEAASAVTAGNTRPGPPTPTEFESALERARNVHRDPFDARSVADAQDSTPISTTAQRQRDASVPEPGGSRHQRRRPSCSRPFILPSDREHKSSSTAPSARVPSVLYELCRLGGTNVDGLRLDRAEASSPTFVDEFSSGSTMSPLTQELETLEGCTGADAKPTHDTWTQLHRLHRRLACGHFPVDELVDHVPRLLAVLYPLSVESVEPQHHVRRGAFICLRSLIVRCVAGACSEPGHPSTWLAKRLTQLLLWCREGIDDAFLEVQQEAAIVLAVVARSETLSPDQHLNALSESLGHWLRGTCVNEATRGWLALLREVGACLERLHTASTDAHTRLDVPHASPRPRTVSKVTMNRVCAVLHACATHSAVDVRRVALLTFAGIWASLGEDSYPFLMPLGDAERKLVSVLFNHAAQQVQQRLPHPLVGFLAAPRAGEVALPWRDLNDELCQYTARAE